MVGFLVSSLVGCTEEIVSSGDSGFPDKLGPYQTEFDLATCQQRRLDLVGALPPNSLVVVATNDTYVRNDDVAYDFRPSSTFFYLTGYDEPNSVAVIRSGPAGPGSAELVLFVEERSAGEVKWLGPTVGIDGARSVFGADEAYDIDEFETRLGDMLVSGTPGAIYGNLDENGSIESRFNSVADGSIPVRSVAGFVDGMRVIKAPIEISAIRRAVDVSVQAFETAMEEIEPGMYEYEVEAFFDYVLRVNGSPGPAFPTIVASGPNINVLHYDANARQMQAGDLVMIDFGAEYGYYASDVTRTLPVDGTFSPEQAVVYDIVLDAHRAVLEATAPGVNYFDLYALAVETVIDGLLEQGIITGNREDIISSRRYRQYFVAGLGHSVGLDVHDPFPDDAPGSRILREGVVMAFEPHVYLDGSDTSVNQAYRGLAARIEDTVVVTGPGVEILSGALPWERADIESLMR